MALEEHILYQNTVDRGSFKLTVSQIENGPARLVVTVVKTGQILLDEQVGLAYNAVFGPDVDDVAMWQDLALVAIDAYLDNGRQ